MMPDEPNDTGIEKSRMRRKKKVHTKLTGEYGVTPNEILEPPRLSVGAKVTWTLIRSHCINENSGDPSLNRIAAKLGRRGESRSHPQYWEKQLQRFCDEFISLGFLERHTRRGTSSTYKIPYELWLKGKKGTSGYPGAHVAPTTLPLFPMKCPEVRTQMSP